MKSTKKPSSAQRQKTRRSDRRKKAVAGTLDFPDEYTKPAVDPEQLLIWLHGPAKFGKSTFASQFEDIVFFETEPGLRFLSTRPVVIRKWEDFLKATDILEKKLNSGYPCKCVAVDTLDNLTKFCMRYVCKTRKMDHPSDQEWGKGWEALFDEFHSAILRLSTLGIGVIFVSHSVEKEVPHRGLTITKHVPNVQATFWRSINPAVDLILHGGFETKKSKRSKKTIERRVLYTKSTEAIEAGDRTGLLPAKLPFDFDVFKSALKEAVNQSQEGE